MRCTEQAYLLKKFPRLSETFVLNEILAQESLGTRLRVFSRRPPDAEPRHPQFDQLIAGIETLPTGRECDPWRVLFPREGGIRHELLEGIGECVEAARGLSIQRFSALLAEAIWLRDRCQELGIRHVHVHFATESAVTAMLLRGLGGPTYSITAHAKDIYRDTVEADLLSALIERSAFTVTVCDANVRHIEAIVSEAAFSRVRRLYNGIDLQRFPMRDGESNKNEILAVGRLVEKKGFHVLLDALAVLRDLGREFHATIIGDGDERENLEKQSRDLALDGRVHFTGPLDQDAVRSAMERATLFCLPCLVGDDGNRDALPTVLLEAQAIGLPIISTPVTGIPEILADGAAGLLVPERDVPATASAIAEVLDRPDLRARLAHAGRERAERLFDGRAAARILSEWFKAAMETNACHGASHS